MKELWISIGQSIEEDRKRSLLELAAGVCDVLLVDEDSFAEARKTSVKLAGYRDDCDISVVEACDKKAVARLKDGKTPVAVKITIKNSEDESAAIEASEVADYLIIDCPDWRVIPLENLVARARGRSKLLAEVTSVKMAELVLNVLELGVDGVLLKTSDGSEVEKASCLTRQPLDVQLLPFKVVALKQIGIGARVCVDTCDIMRTGEGILVGCQSSGLFLVEAEVHENPHVATRPFRINAGPASLYTLSSLDRTRYLSELKGGDEVLIVGRDGSTRLSNVGRVKIEWRPLMVVEAQHNGKSIRTIVQNAETVRFVTPDGSKSIAELQPGNEVLVHVTDGGRHFGTLVKEERVIER
jgi:3-dehydroquinate synthase II